MSKTEKQGLNPPSPGETRLVDEEDQLSASVESTDTGGTPSSGLNSAGISARMVDQPAIAQQEQRNVFRLRMLVMLVLLASTIGVAIGVFMYVDNAEQRDFEEQYHDDSHKVLASIGTSLDLTLGAVDAFIVALVSYARDTNSSWPFVTFPDYAVRTSKLRSISKAVLSTQYHWVEDEERSSWENYSVDHDEWVQAGIDTQKTDKNFKGTIVSSFWTRGDIHDDANYYNASGPYLPKWQNSPVVPIYAPYNWDGMTLSSLFNALHILKDDRKIVFGDIHNIADSDDPNAVSAAANNNLFIKDYVGDEEDETEPFSDIFFPILDVAADYVEVPQNASSTDLGKMVGVFAMTFYWRDLLKNILPDGSNGIIVVFENACGEAFTYELNGPETRYLGEGDLHETDYDDLSIASRLTDLHVFSEDSTYSGLSVTEEGCAYDLHVYPSSSMENEYKTSDPLVFMSVAVAIFLFTSLVFVYYDINGKKLHGKASHRGTIPNRRDVFSVERRQAKVMQSAVQSNAIVASLFPSNVRERLFQHEQQVESYGKFEHNKTRIKSFLSDSSNGNKPLDVQENPSSQTPIADLFPQCTVLFSDICGFTAWSSVREPSQVFTLLEALYGAFDKLATKRNVFKVETIGDAYVAVVGLPEPCKDHAVVMAKFARDCLFRMMDVVQGLEKSLGPGTADLKVRFGLHSGAVTAGVLRGQKSRFQLFGDTVNTASRMESTGAPNKIQVSSVTAALLMDAGKHSWVIPREDKVEAKGKGLIQAYWIEPKLMGSTQASEDNSFLDVRSTRLVEWQTDILGRYVRKVIAKRLVVSDSIGITDTAGMSRRGDTLLDEVTEVISLPAYDPGYGVQQDDPTSADFDEDMFEQLQDYVVAVAALYNDNPFHCFDHASHVSMSTAKLLSRIVKPEEVLVSQGPSLSEEELARSLHEHTFGITSDPLAQFACIFAALIHDLEHPGVPNSTLVAEQTSLATRYKDRSVAEQNSVDIAWGMFMQDSYSAFRRAICPNEYELERFRQLVVNIVLATDIMDPDLKKLRNDRWEKAFSAEMDESSPQESLNRKATIVMEHLIQASDVAHTMQHWHIYIKWNEKLFSEMYAAFQSGRSSKDPAEFWYEGEIKFLDNYVIPLARKLRNCGVFGVSSDEYLNYALKNREEWDLRGKEVVAGWVAKRSGSSSHSR
eukprot:Nitzschia sp. Nitz4//scaffold6_size259037//151917//155608//NITZ4_001087-RA/size259037-processed-gene-0.270-mRNA-1//-1//CDS//3329556932//2155//frame0